MTPSLDTDPFGPLLCLYDHSEEAIVEIPAGLLIELTRDMVKPRPPDQRKPDKFLKELDPLDK